MNECKCGAEVESGNSMCVTCDYEERFKIEVYEYLDDLRESGIANMFGAGEYLEAEFGLSKKDAKAHLINWMRQFGK